MKQIKYIVAVKGYGVFSFPSELNRQAFIRDIKKKDKNIQYATSIMRK